MVPSVTSSANANHVFQHILPEQAPVVPVVGREPILIPAPAQDTRPVRIDHMGFQEPKMVSAIVRVKILTPKAP